MGAGEDWERGVAYALRGWSAMGSGYRGMVRVTRGYVLDVERHEAAVDVITVLDADTGWVGRMSHVEVTS